VLSPGIVLQQRYRIKRLLARGGMGAVYEAEAVHLRNATVAVKETFFSEDRRSLREQFEREAATLARLRHPALPQVKDHFIEGGGQFLVMDFIAGDDLGALLRQRLDEKGSAFGFRQVMEWAERLLDALDYIHGQYPPVIHRDIKPQNLKLTPRGELFLIDFGLAKDATTPTSTGHSVHAYTLEFAPPEQIKGEGTDARSDIYSLGATLYNLATGKLPPDARIREEVVVRHLMPDLLQPAHQVNPQIPFAFAAALAKALALDRGQRYQSAQEMRQALRQIKQVVEDEVAEKERRGAERRSREEEERKRREEESRRRKIEERRRREKEARRQAALLPLIIGSVLAVAIIAVSIYILWPRQSPLAPNQTDARRAEVLRYSVEREGGNARSTTLDLASNKGFKLHFTPRESGYLYLLSPEEEGGNLAPRLFAQPVRGGADFGYPDGWLDPDPKAKQVRITVIFSSERIMLLDFLFEAARDKRPLTGAEQRSFQNFRNLAAPSEPRQDDSLGDNPAVVVSAIKNGQPLVFEIVSNGKLPGG
jgi:tRNA A-37 threonylcarbamoyl transferase component Bud32